MMPYKDIQEQFNKVIEFSNIISSPKTDELFENWYNAKKGFIDKFGGLIYEVPKKVQFTLNADKKTELFNSFVDMVFNVYQNDALGAFLEQEEEGFYQNVVIEDYPLCNCHGKKIAKGTKLLKAFKYFEEDPNTLKVLQDKASVIIQEDKVEGTLCLSVHPLDYLSSSENTYNWRSCHALDGDYRAGNLSYMGDSSTVICYLKGADGVILPHFPSDVLWNSKKWRTLLFFSEDLNMILAGRQYPFSSKEGLDLLLKEINIIFNNCDYDYRYADWDNEYITSNNLQKNWLDDRYIPYQGKLYEMSNFIFDESNLHFNDLLGSSCYTTPYYSTRGTIWGTVVAYSIPHFHIGSQVKCLKCEREYLKHSESFVCNNCYDGDTFEDYWRCEICDGYITEDNVYAGPNGEVMCEYCHDQQVSYCPKCGASFYRIEGTYSRDYDDLVCPNCEKAALKDAVAVAKKYILKEDKKWLAETKLKIKLFK